MAKARTTPVSGSKKSSAAASPTPAARDAEALERVLAMMAIPATSGLEGRVATYIREALLEAGADPSWFAEDRANKKTPIPSDTGNLACRFPGTMPGPRRLLMAHMDTVPICVGSRPQRKGNRVVSADPQTGLGADDRAGCAVVLGAAIALLREGLPHPPLTFLWTIQEEIGLHGARLLDIKILGKPALAFNWDGGSPAKLTIGATGGYRMTVRIEGLASHAGNAPEKGVSAIAIAGLAIADLQRRGWHGAIRKGKRRGTSNVGVIQGGAATNVVCDEVTLRIEARSHDPEFRGEIIRAIEEAFREAVERVSNVDGVKGKVSFDGRLDYESFRLEPSEPTVVAAQEAVAASGLEPVLSISDGGLDANWLSVRGVPTVTLGCGQRDPHMKTESLEIDEYLAACRIARRLATGG